MSDASDVPLSNFGFAFHHVSRYVSAAPGSPPLYHHTIITSRTSVWAQIVVVAVMGAMIVEGILEGKTSGIRDALFEIGDVLSSIKFWR